MDDISLLFSPCGMTLAERLLELGNAEFNDAQSSLFEHCKKTQEAVLMEILARGANTEYGKAYGFGEIRSAEDYRAKVPLSVWPDYEPYSQRLEDGEENILFPGKTKVFYITSGTTGRAKHLPDSAEGLACRKLISRSRQAYLLSCLNGQAGKLIVMANPPVSSETRGGIPCGYASGQTLDIQSRETREMLAYPYSLSKAYSGDDFHYMLLRCALPSDDIACVMGNNSMMLNLICDYAVDKAELLIEDIRNGTCALAVPQEISDEVEPFLTANPERARFLAELLESGRFVPRFYWPKLALACFWLSGSVGRYVEETKKILPESTKYMDIGYGSSELKFNIPMKPDSPAGALAVYGGFFEFIPENGETTLLAHQLEDGKNYELVITTYAGLYRYRMKDIVRVDGFAGNTPCIYFISKVGDTASIYKESIPGYIFYEYIKEAARDCGIEMTFGQIYCDYDGKHYVACIESRDQGDIDLQTLAKAIDDKVRASDILYDRYRNIVLRPITAVMMKPGWKDYLLKNYAKRAGSAAQVKLPVMTADMPDAEWIRQR